MKMVMTRLISSTCSFPSVCMCALKAASWVLETILLLLIGIEAALFLNKNNRLTVSEHPLWPLESLFDMLISPWHYRVPVCVLKDITCIKTIHSCHDRLDQEDWSVIYTAQNKAKYEITQQAFGATALKLVYFLHWAVSPWWISELCNTTSHLAQAEHCE